MIWLKKISREILDGNIKIDDIDTSLISKNLYQDLPPIDLLIRTSGEYRVSNYMLYQLAYAEMYFIDTLFPDFNEFEFDKALVEYQNRDRRFGSDKK